MQTSKKRLLWFSNAPWAHSGYANQTALAMQHLPPLGYHFDVLCNFGLRGGRIDAGETTFYPGGYEASANDVVAQHARKAKADAVISLFDAHPLHFRQLDVPWIAWVPVDHQPAPPAVVEALRGYPEREGDGRPADRVVAYSQFGQRELEKAGIPAAYIPHGVDTQLFSPGSQRAAREALGLPQNVFLVAMVGTNVYWPSRKCIPQAMQAFARLAEHYDDALLYLHMEETGVRDGLRLKPLIDALGLGEHVKVADPYQYLLGYPDTFMRDLYRAADVLLAPSMGEGFGLPIMEAQACGLPVIVNDWTAMPELVAGGWVNTEYEKFWTRQDAWQVIPHVDALAHCLFEAYDSAAGSALHGFRRENARAKAEEYDFATVVAPAWHKLLREFFYGGGL